VTAADVNLELGVWTLTKHKTMKKTGRPRVVYLTPTMVELTRRLKDTYPDGPLFRNHRGKTPWNRNSVRLRFRRLRDKLPELGEFISYS
jgi:integrase